jgi:hypothetical protein
MSPWLWLLFPVMLTGLAWVWATWRGRPRGPGDPLDTVQEHERFRAALAGARTADDVRRETRRVDRTDEARR